MCHIVHIISFVNAKKTHNNLEAYIFLIIVDKKEPGKNHFKINIGGFAQAIPGASSRGITASQEHHPPP